MSFIKSTNVFSFVSPVRWQVSSFYTNQTEMLIPVRYTTRLNKTNVLTLLVKCKIKLHDFLIKKNFYTRYDTVLERTFNLKSYTLTGNWTCCSSHSDLSRKAGVSPPPPLQTSDWHRSWHPRHFTSWRARRSVPPAHTCTAGCYPPGGAPTPQTLEQLQRGLKPI